MAGPVADDVASERNCTYIRDRRERDRSTEPEPKEDLMADPRLVRETITETERIYESDDEENEIEDESDD